MQGWLADQRDPRTIAVILGIVLLFVVPVFLLMFHTFREDVRYGPRGPGLEVAGPVSVRYQETALGRRAFVTGTLANEGQTAATRVWIRVDFLDAEKERLDSVLELAEGLVVPGGESSPFRVSAIVSVTPEEVSEIRATVERTRAAQRWD